MGDDQKKPFLNGLLIKMWEVFIEKLLVPVVMGALALGFATCQQQANQKMVDDVYQKVAEKLNKELPATLETLRKQVNSQGESLDQIRTAVLELGVRHKIEDELRRGSGTRPSRLTPPKPPASQPSEEPFRLLKARPEHKALAPFRQKKLQDRLSKD